MNLKALLPAVVFAALIGLFAFGLSRDPAVLPSQLLDKPFPEFSLGTLDETDEPLSRDVLIGKVSVINVFGSWCVSCVVEHPKLVEISDDPRFQLVGINWRDTRPKAKAWLTRYRNPYAQILFDGESRLAIDLGVSGAPETFITDRSGRIRYKHVGPITDEDWTDTLSPLIDLLRAEPEPVGDASN